MFFILWTISISTAAILLSFGLLFEALSALVCAQAFQMGWSLRINSRHVHNTNAFVRLFETLTGVDTRRK